VLQAVVSCRKLQRIDCYLGLNGPVERLQRFLDRRGHHIGDREIAIFRQDLGKVGEGVTQLLQLIGRVRPILLIPGETKLDVAAIMHLTEQENWLSSPPFGQSPGWGYEFMDRITTAVLAEFARSHQVADLPEDQQFEHLAAFVTVRRHHARTFDTADIVISQEGGAGIDAVAIIVNGALVTDIDSINELAERNGYLEASFVFVEADRSPSFGSAKIGNIGFGVEDFFREIPQLPRGPKLSDAAAITKTIYDRGSLFRAKPSCRLYYVTTGTWSDDQNLLARRKGCVAALEASHLFGQVDFFCVGADQLHRLYNQTKTAVTREFSFKDRSELPAVPGVEQAYLGFVPAKEFIAIISDDSGDDILGGIFDENVRDWQDYNEVNDEMRGTLESEHRARFVLMNNGVTIITRNIRQLGSKFAIEDFQVVNGCQTSNVIFGQRRDNLESVSIPLRLIATQDDDIKEAIIKATNRQTELKPEQLYALTDFAKKLEAFFNSYEEPYKLYYERRDGQYDRFPSIEKTRIVSPNGLIRSFAAMFLDEPTRVTRGYRTIREMVGDKIFKEEHRLEPYYASAYAAYRLDFLFRNHRLDSAYKAARYHLLMTFRYLVNPLRLPRMNSRDMESRCLEIINILWDEEKADALLADAADVVRQEVGEPFDRDHIRTEVTRDALVERLSDG
jgi:hypothetical protein